MTQISRPFAGILCLGAMLGFLAASPLALADDAQAPKAETASEQSTKKVRHLPPTAITFHSIALDGQNVPYSAVAGSISLRDNRGETTAEIFYVSYAKDPEDAKRPVTFVFNGGPGAASAYLHLGAIGPKIVEANENGNCSDRHHD
ncbi:MAG: hypothetical protein R3D01_09325 [Hyphomicrobiales bacterium]